MFEPKNAAVQAANNQAISDNQTTNNQYFEALKKQLEKNQAIHGFTVKSIESAPLQHKWMREGSADNNTYGLENFHKSPANCPKCKITLDFPHPEFKGIFQTGSFELDPKSGMLRVNHKDPNSIKAAILFEKSRGRKEMHYLGDVKELSKEERDNIVKAFTENGMGWRDKAGNRLEKGVIVDKEGKALDSQAPAPVSSSFTM